MELIVCGRGNEMIVFLDDLRARLAYRIAKTLSKTGITPNQITIFRFVISFPSVLYFFSRGEHLYNLIGLAVYLVLVPLDWVDGDLARLTNQSSSLGKWLDDTSDRILVLSVLGGLFYAGIASDPRLWGSLTLAFFSIYFFLTTLLEDFNKHFDLEFSQYAKVEEEALAVGQPFFLDRILVNLLNIHRNSFSKFLFCISYPLFVGIVVDQLFLTFVFLIITFSLRSLGVMFLMYSAARGGKTKSRLVEVLRSRL